MASKAAKRRQRKARQSARQMQAQWQAQERASPQPQDDPCRVVLSARCRRLGRADNAANRRAVAWEGMGDPAGMAIAMGAQDIAERDALWDLIKRLDGAHEAYHRRIIGRPRFPRCTKIEFLPERFETRPDDRPDTRTDAEKDADAKDAWASWLRLISETTISDRIALLDGIWRRCEMVAGGSLTAGGAGFVRALKNLLAVEKGA